MGFLLRLSQARSAGGGFSLVVAETLTPKGVSDIFVETRPVAKERG
jgi:hypothetical protein